MRRLWFAILVTLLMASGLSACISAPDPKNSTYGPEGLGSQPAY